MISSLYQFCSTAPKEKKVASLDGIVADVKRHKKLKQEEFLEHQQEEMEKAKQLISPEYPHANDVNTVRVEGCLPCTDVSYEGLESPMEVEEQQQRPLPFNFGDDSDESPTRYFTTCIHCTFSNKGAFHI